MEEVAILPEQAPVMPLPGALLFPHALLPLHIFEPRYREMLEYALARERMFCIALLRPQPKEWHNDHDFFDVATIGLIRACVGRSDGTSNLILQGLQRVSFTSFAQLDPFPVAEFETLQSETETTVETEALGSKVLELYGRFRTMGRKLPAKIDKYVTGMTDLAMLADLMASTFIVDPLRRQQILEELDLNNRLRLVIQYLREESGTAAA
ncbi:MAG: LON peptidase substrate-binding domain-containing protein [Verrucomicrobia bacterium]|nr:LON peptidase substrate-binding domain-containing protein [Verrucomicrobiota bacterium]